MSTSAGSSLPIIDVDEGDYQLFLQRLALNFERVQQMQLFTVSIEGLFDTFLDALPTHKQQHYNCRTCKNFVERFGNLVTVDEVGTVRSVVWNLDTGSQQFNRIVNALAHRVQKARISGVFVSNERVLGVPETVVSPTAPPKDIDPPGGKWYHMAVANANVYQNMIKTPSQHIAEKLQDYGQVERFLNEYGTEILNLVVVYLETKTFNGAAACVAQAKWLLDLRTRWGAVRNVAQRSNILWAAVGPAPAGFCHPRSGVLSTLLDDLAGGMTFDKAKARFDAKMDPLKYQRPAAPPKAGNVDRANVLFDQMGLAPALRRRYATVDDILEWIWRERVRQPVPSQGTGLFDHLKPAASEQKSIQSGVPRTTISMEKFVKNILPTVSEMMYYIDGQNKLYCPFVTAVDPASPRILKWDHHVSWYVHRFGSSPRSFGLPPNSWVKVLGVTKKPCFWGAVEGMFDHLEHAIHLVLNEGKDNDNNCLALFPVCIRSELREVSSVIEAFSNNGQLEVPEGKLATTLMQHNKVCDALVRVTTNGVQVEYHIDRWD